MNRTHFPQAGTLIAALLAITTVGLIGAGASAADTARPGAGSDKATAPTTDLASHPKLAMSAPDPSRWGTSQAAPAVVATSVNADGSASMTTYTPVKGESPSVLYRLLKSRGVPGLRDPAAPRENSPTATTAGLSACAYGTAQLYQCSTDSNVAHQFHWANGCCTDPQVWFVDHTSSLWPINASTTTWNQAAGIDSSYVFGSCPGYSGEHCVDVTDRNAGCSGWEGLTHLSYDSTSYNIVSASVELNDYNGTCTVGTTTYNYNKTSNGYRQDACHELGHALGMGHNSSTNSCLYGTVINSSTALQPNSDDFTLIAQLYSVDY